MEIRLNKKHPKYKEQIKGWLGEDFDPEYFDVNKINEKFNKINEFKKEPKKLWGIK